MIILNHMFTIASYFKYISKSLKTNYDTLVIGVDLTKKK